jgi:hypothetical protein
VADLLGVLGGFRAFALGGARGAAERYAAEEKRLQAADQLAKDPAVRLALEQSEASARQSAMETGRVYENVVNFTDSVGGLLRSASLAAKGCLNVHCGPHASCTMTPTGAECICKEGYVGLARERSCRPPPEFLPRALLLQDHAMGTSRVGDLELAVFQENRIAVVFRDLSQEDTGRVIVGKVHEAGSVDVSAPVQFTSPAGRAFGPVVTGTEDGRILIAWRDENRMATCWMRGAVLGAEGLPGDFALRWGAATDFCRDQAHKMAALHVSGSKIALLYSDKVGASRFKHSESFGNSLLAEVGPAGDVQILGTYRFANYPVCRLEAARISPTSFVVGVRAAAVRADDSSDAAPTEQGALALYGELVGSDLVFDTSPLSIAPDEGQIWARGVSLIAPNTFAYAYQQGDNEQIRVAVAEVDPLSHSMRMVQDPVVLRHGVSPYVSMLSVPYSASDPHALSYYESGNSSKVTLCSWSIGEKRLHHCEEFEWLSHPVSSVAGAHLGRGRSLMVFATGSGTPYYGMFGLSKK